LQKLKGNRLDRVDAMRAFIAVADRASFSAAARALRWSAASVTRSVAWLEQDLGLSLLSRTTRSVRLTDRGVIYAEHCRRILADLETARSIVRGEDAAPRGTLSVTAPVVFGRLHILPVVEALLEAHADLSVRLTLVDRDTHLVEEGFDVAVRIGDLADSALIAVPIAQVRRVVVASPGYLARHGRPDEPSDLRGRPVVAFEGLGSTDAWTFAGAPPRSVKLQPRLVVNTADAAIAAAARGVGLTRVLSYQVAEAIEHGALEVVLAQWEPPPAPVNVLYQAGRRGSPNIAAFVAEARRRLVSLRPAPGGSTRPPPVD
jgi:DNA-binding transcriptional LysR family regulator